MFAREVNAAVGSDGGGEFTEAYKGPRAARPLVFRPALRIAAFEVAPHTGKDAVKLLRRRLDPLFLFQIRDTLGFARSRLGHQDSTWSRLTPRRLPNLNRTSREHESVKSLFFPESIFGL